MRRLLLPLARRASDATLMARALARRDGTFTLPPQAGRPPDPVLAVAPHPDDEAIGCGGTLALAAAPAVVFLTADSLRRAEAEASVERLGAGRVDFLGLRDGALADDVEDGAAELARIVREVAPACVLVPYPLDRHPDHNAAARLVARSLEGIETRIWCYEVWSPLDPNRLVDITAVAGAKREAIGLHASQCAGLPYADAALGLARYRSLLLPGAQYAEAFLECSHAELAALGGSLR